MNKQFRYKLLAQILLASSQILAPVLTYPLITRALEAEGIGRIGYTDSIAQFLIVCASLGIPLYGIREIAVQPSNRKHTFRELFIILSVLAALACIFLYIVGLILKIDPILINIGLITIIGGVLNSDWYFQGKDSFVWVAMRSVLFRVVSVILILVLVRKASDLYLYYFILAANVFCTALINLVIILNEKEQGKKQLSLLPHIKKVSWLYAINLLIAVYTILDSVWLGILATKTAVGYYWFAYKLVRMSAMLIISAGVLFVPRISKHYKEQEDILMQEQIITSQQLIFFFSIPLSVFLYVMAPDIVAALANANFYPAIITIRILSVIPILISLSHLTCIQIMVPARREKPLFIILLGGGLLNIALNFLWIPVWQQNAAATANVVAETFITVVSAFYIYNKKLFKPDMRSFLFCLASSLIIFPVSWLLHKLPISPLFLLILCFVSISIIYFFLQFSLPVNPFAKKLILRNQANG